MQRRREQPERPLPRGGTVTAIVPSPRAPGRFSVVIDGHAGPTLGLEALERLALHVGASTIGREAAIHEEEETLRVYDRAVMMLAARGRAARDLEWQLVRKGEPADLVRRAVERLTAQGFLDDAAFARSFVRSKAGGAQLAKRRLQQELGRKGVERTVVTEAIDDVFSEEEIDEAAAAETLARKRNRALGDVDAASRRRRLYAFLARRGYSPDIVADAVSKVIKGDPTDFDGAAE